MLRLHNLSFFYGDQPVFQHINLTFHKERTGLVGHNGSGKSTLLKILLGELSPQEGTIHYDGMVGYLPQSFAYTPGERIIDTLDIAPQMDAWQKVEDGTATDKEYTLLENDWDIKARFEHVAVLMRIESIDPYRKIDTLSGGEITRIHCMRLLLKHYTYLLLDEPTNHLDIHGRQAILDLIDTFSGGIIVASHDRELLAHMDRIVEVAHGTTKVYGGDWNIYAQEKETQELAIQKKVHKATQSLRLAQIQAQQTKERQEKRSSKGAKDAAKGGIPKILLGGRKDRSQQTSASLARTHEQKIASDTLALSEARSQLTPTRNFSILLPKLNNTNGKVMINIRNVSHAYGEQRILQNFSFQIHSKDRLALTGPNGSGKSTVLALCAGTTPIQEGTIRTATPFGYFDQHTQLLHDSESVLNTFSRFHPNTTESKKRIILAEFLFPSAFLDRTVAQLSGGERSRLALACILTKEPANQLLILDEPTNHMDIQSIEVIESALSAYTGTLLVVSHDNTFLKKVGCLTHIELQNMNNYDE